MAHPIRPDEYEAIDNFYTVTVYEKGAEVIRMLPTLLGAAAYRKGSDLYFARHDGTAATCDDFVAAMETASGRDLTQFKRWYSQAGTPVLAVTDAFDAAAKRYTLTVEQTVPPTPSQLVKQPMVIPLSMALVQANGEVTHAQVLQITETTQQFHFDGVSERPVPSLLRGFSAPVKVNYAYTDTQLAMLAAKDSDGVVRWQAMRSLFVRSVRAAQRGTVLPAALFDAVAALLADNATDPALIAHSLAFPDCTELADLCAAGELIEPIRIADAREAVIQRVARDHRAAIFARHNAERSILAASPYATNAASTARRALANTLLCLANAVTDDEAQQLALNVWSSADNLTDLTAAMAALRDQLGAVRERIYTAFHDQWQDDLSMLNRWFQFEVATERVDAAAHATALLAHPKFDGKNPNRVRAIVQFFGDYNWRGFHAADGSGYAFIADQILRFDAQNPSLAARFCEVFSRWHKCAEPQQVLQRAQLERIVAEPTISPNVREILEKTLKAGGTAQ